MDNTDKIGTTITCKICSREIYSRKQRMIMKNILLIVILLLLGCSQPDNPNYLGYVEKLPKGTYTIYNWGSRHMVRCERPDGKYYMLNDGSFKENGIKGYDAHQYTNPVKVIIN